MTLIKIRYLLDFLDFGCLGMVYTNKSPPIQTIPNPECNFIWVSCDCRF